MKDSLRQVDEATVETLYPLIGRQVGPVSRRYVSRFTPALVHGDCTPKNALPTPDGWLVLVGWDEAAAAFRVRDYAGLTYWYSYTRKDVGRPRPRDWRRECVTSCDGG